MPWVFEDEEEQQDPTRGSFTPSLSDQIRGPLASPPMERPASFFGNFSGDLPEMGENEFEKEKQKVTRSFLTDPIDAATFLAPGGLPTRLAYQGVLGAGRSAVEGQSPLSGAAWGAGTQGAAEAAFLPLRAAGSIYQGVKAKKGFEEATTKYGEDVAKQATDFTQATKEWAEQKASTLMDSLKNTIPAIQDLASDTKGLVSAFYGKGRDAVQAQYREYLQGIKDVAGDKVLPFRLADLEAIKVDPIPPTNPPMGVGSATVGDVIDAITGKSKGPTQGAYRRIVDQLDTLGIGDPAERAAYKTYEGMRQFLDRTGALKGREFHPEKIDEGLLNIKKAREITGRNLGNADEGILSEMNLGAPQQPSPLNPPTPPDITNFRFNPWAARALGHAVGGPLGGHAGIALGEVAPRGGIPFGRNSIELDALLSTLPTGLAAILRQYLRQ